MLKDCLEIFEKYKGDSDDVILDTYILAEGDYIVVNKDGSLDHSFIKFDKKTRTIENEPMNYDELCFYDYYSSLVSINKAVDRKKIIHSNNYLSFFIKQDNLHSGKLTKEVIDNYYKTLANPGKKYTKKTEKIMYENVEEKLGKVDKEKLEFAKNWIIENILNIGEENEIVDSENNEVVKLSGGKTYLKIFFEEEEDEYIKEGNRYLFMKLFNNNDYSVSIDGTILGLPNDNMGLNSKKTYLEHKNLKNTVPYLITFDEALLQKKFFDYMMNQLNLGKNVIYLDNSGILEDKDLVEAKKIGEEPENKFSGFMLVIKKEKEVSIINYDILSNYNKKLKRQFQYKNYTGIRDKGEVIDSVDDKKKLEGIINEIMFYKYLVGNYFTKPSKISLVGDIKKGDFKKHLVLSRNAIFDWLYKDCEFGMKKVINNIFPLIIRESMNKGHVKKAIYQFNLYLSLKEYFKGDETMNYISMEEELFKKINDETVEKVIKSDEEYYYAIGQLVNYYISKNKGWDKKHYLVNQFINSKNDTDLRKKLMGAFKSYSYAIPTYATRFNNLYGMILAYNNAEKVNQEAIIAGYLRDNMIYRKKKEDNEGKNNIDNNSAKEDK